MKNTQKNLNEETNIITSNSKTCINFVNRWLTRLNLNFSHLETLLSKYGKIELPASLSAYNSRNHSIKCTDSSGEKTIIILSVVTSQKSKITFKTDSFEKVFTIDNISDAFTVTLIKTISLRKGIQLEYIRTTPEFTINLFSNINNVILRLDASDSRYYNYIRNDILRSQSDFYDFLFNIELPFSSIKVYNKMKSLFSFYPIWGEGSTITLVEYPDKDTYARAINSKNLDLHAQENMIVIKNGNLSKLQMRIADVTFYFSNTGEWQLSNDVGSILKTSDGKVIYNGEINYENFSYIDLQADFAFGESLFKKFKKYVQ